MATFKKVSCINCKKRFYKDKGHYNENLKLGNNFYCSRKCQYTYKMQGKFLICGRSGCNKKFYRMPHEITIYNYCSQSCAAIVNNQRYPKWPKRYCVACGKEFKNRESKYCSSKCGWLILRNYHPAKYTREQIITIIKKYYQKHKRVPAKRDILELTHRVPHLFGSWNKVILAAGFTPNRSHDNRMYIYTSRPFSFNAPEKVL